MFHKKTTHSESLSIKLTGLWHTLTDLWPGRRPRGHHKVSVNQMSLINPETKGRLVQRKHRQQVCRYMSNYLKQHEHPARNNVSKITKFVFTSFPSVPFYRIKWYPHGVAFQPICQRAFISQRSPKNKALCNKRAQGPDSSFGSRW